MLQRGLTPCTLHGTLMMPKDGLSAVLLKEDGVLCFERIGECDEDTGTNFIVVYQRGLTPAQPVARCHKSLLSPFKIKSNDHKGNSNVPWANFVWLANSRTGRVTARTCTDCDGEDCAKCFEGLTANNVMVVCIHSDGGFRIYQWYVAFEGNRKVLTRIPSHVVNSIAANSSVAELCSCGRCMHPICNMVNTRTPISDSAFDERAFRYFANLRVLVKESRKGVLQQLTKAATSLLEKKHIEEGTCAICLEETFVRTESCVRQRCSLKVCSDCHLKTRGMCCLCDRAKLGCSSSFMCHSCDKAFPLDKYGYECLKCNNNVLCGRCYKNFGMCLGCECDISNNRPKKSTRHD